MPELVDIVDCNDAVVRICTRKEADEKHELRRASRVLIINNDGELLLQRRSLNKKINPGMWDFGIVESVQSGEDYMSAAIRGLKEEFNIIATPKFLFKIAYSDMTLRRITSVYELCYGGRYKQDLSEVAEAGWFSKDKVNGMIKNGMFPQIAIEAYRQYEIVK
jgi:isopentenyldiphosphate isomerase